MKKDKEDLAKWRGNLIVTRFVGVIIRYLFFLLVCKKKTYKYLSGNENTYNQQAFNAIVGISAILTIILFLSRIGL